MSEETLKVPRSLVVLTSMAVISAVLITLNMMHDQDTALPISIVAAGGLIGMGLAARG